MKTIQFSGFYDLTLPEEMAGVMAGIYGGEAETAAAECVEAALTDNRANDCVFWLEVGRWLRHEKTPHGRG